MANVPHDKASDSISTYLSDANTDFFGTRGSVDTATIAKAVVGFVVFAVGLSIILTQIL